MTRPETLRPKRWQVAAPAPADYRHALSQYHQVLRQLFYNRRLETPAAIQAFLDGRTLESDDPFLLADMEAAVTRIQQAIERDEMIVVYGDFDADGVTATVLLVEALRSLGVERGLARPYIPDRVDEGYGLNNDALAKIKAWGAGLVISVDCGIRSVDKARFARDIGLDLIITDHHSLGKELPPALAVINPKRPDSLYPDTRLAGVGIAFKLAQALRRAMPERVQFDEEALLDLVALGTVADVAALLGENRRLVTAGLRVLNERRRPGLAALAQIAGLKPGGMTAESIAFGLGPRINAAGRLAHAYKAAKLLAVNNLLEAGPLARELDQLNRKRQQVTNDLSRHAETLIEPGAPLLVAVHASFLAGVVGLVATRLNEKYYRPVMVIEQGAKESRGSARSIDEFHITDALDEVGTLLVRYGGHSRAAGFTVRNERLPAFLAQMRALAQAKLDGQELLPVLAVDAEVAPATLDWALFELLAQMEPFGEKNPRPVFASRGVHVVDGRAVGGDGTHLKLRLADGNRTFDAIAFRQGAWAGRLPPRIDIAYTLSLNEWNGLRTLQLEVQDIKEADS